MYYSRSMEDRWNEISEQFPVLLLTGPRQAGKSTLLRHLSEPGRRIVTLDDLNLRALARRDPALFLQEYPPPVLIDEIQYAPQLMSQIKILVDARKRAGDFWLTGSQQFRLMEGVTESLAGRVAIVNLLGFSMREAGRRVSRLDPFLPVPENISARAATASATDLKAVYREIWQGSFPAVRTGTVKEHALFYRSYLQTYIERDVRDLSQVGDIEAFVRFLTACAARTGQLLNLSDASRDAGISVGTARNWLSILIASFQVYLLQPVRANITARLCKTPKIYFLDTGFAAYLTEWTSPATLASGAMCGHILETHVLIEILKSWWHRVEFPNLSYYRDRDGREIDFVIRKDNVLYPIEVKRSAAPKADSLRNFGALQRFPQEVGNGAVVCLTPDPVPIDRKTRSVPVGIL